MEKKTVWLPMFRKIVPADYEAWLEGLALEGWNVDKIDQMSALKMAFNKTEPKKYRYVYDIDAFPKKDYRNIYEQFGWEFVGQNSNSFIWRKEYTDVRPESFTDMESVMKRNQRVKTAVTVCFVLFIAGILAALGGIAVCLYVGKTEKIIELVLETALCSVISSYLWWVIKKIKRNIDR